MNAEEKNVCNAVEVNLGLRTNLSVKYMAFICCTYMKLDVHKKCNDYI